jgi:hypothetical protein
LIPINSIQSMVQITKITMVKTCAFIINMHTNLLMIETDLDAVLLFSYPLVNVLIYLVFQPRNNSCLDEHDSVNPVLGLSPIRKEKHDQHG